VEVKDRGQPKVKISLSAKTESRTESAHFPTFGAEVETVTETEIQSTSGQRVKCQDEEIPTD